MFKLREYQTDLEKQIVANMGICNTLAVLPCGGGKTVLFSKITHDYDQPLALIVHRQELVGQISLTLARFGVVHDIIAPRPVINHIVKLHVKETGRSYYNDRSDKKVAGVDTLIRRRDADFVKWCKRVKFWVQDEAHHVLKDNKWGKAAALFNNATGLGVTATPIRADGKGLGRHNDGVFDDIVEGPDLRWMIDQGFLTDYKIYAPPSDVDYSGLKTTAGGDYNGQDLRKREEKSHIFGDVVEHFNRIAAGKQGITFASSIKSAIDFAAAFNAGGINSIMVSGETKDAERNKADAEFRAGRIRQMTNVDLFGEGYDLPVLDCVTMARKTESFGLFVQQSTRCLRPAYAKGYPLDTKEQRLAAIAAGPKPFAFIIDHVGNVERHAVARNGKIDLCYRSWDLERRERKTKSSSGNEVPVKSCVNPECANVYDAILPACPFCGNAPPITNRTEPANVAGDLCELDPHRLKQIKTEIERQQGPFHAPQGIPEAGRIRAQRLHYERQKASDELRETIAQWAGQQRASGLCDRSIMKKFYYAFGVDLLSCQTGTANEQTQLKNRIENL